MTWQDALVLWVRFVWWLGDQPRAMQVSSRQVHCENHLLGGCDKCALLPPWA